MSENAKHEKVSAIIATRNRPELLRRAIDAIWNQDYEGEIEIVVVFDQCDPDESLVREEGNRSLKVTTNVRSQGLAGGRNSGVDFASGAWVAYCDDDDEWLPSKLSSQFEAIANTPDAKAACTGIFINYEDEDTERIPDPDGVKFEDFIRDRMTEVHPSSWLVNRSFLLNEVGYVDEEIPGGYAEDYDFMLRTVKKTPLAVATKPLVRIYWHGASFFFEKWKMIDDALEYLVNKHPEFKDDDRGLARIRGQQAVAKAAMGDRKEALGAVIDVAKLNPLEKRNLLALVVALGLPAEFALKQAHKVGKGI